MATIVDVARLAGVSTSTVSHVVNGTRKVAPETRDRVLAAISSTDYHQHGPARALRRSRTDTIALVISEAGYPVLDRMALGVEQQARRSGMTVFLAHSGDDPEQELAAVLALRDRRVDGILLAPVVNSLPEIPQLLAASEVPLVLLDRPSPSEIDQVSVSNSEPTGELVEHVVRAGHRRIAFVAQGSFVSTFDERLTGYEGAMASAGLARIVIRADEASAIRPMLRVLLESPTRPTAILCASQISTVRVLHACNELGLSIPDDVSIVAFDEFPFADVFRPRLTSVVQPAKRMGRKAVQLVERRIRKPNASIKRIRLEPKIQYRDSVKDLTL